MKLLQEIHRKPVLPVGQLSPVVTTCQDSGNDDENKEWKEIKGFLDKQEKGSVVYVAFGSEAKPSQLKLTELAHGLEISGLSFFWALRKQRGPADPEFVELPFYLITSKYFCPTVCQGGYVILLNDFILPSF